MANLIKKQILKHLSKFAKNLSPDSINLSALRGEGELSDLDLDCTAIQNLINLPTWLRINHVKCNKVSIKIPWTKTGTSPITIKFDVVDVLMSTCETPRAPNGASPIQDSSGGGETSYGSMQRILEGIAVRIDSINVEFTSTVFTAVFQVSQLVVFSANPEGFSDDLRLTRLINKPSRQVLTFKKISWQTMRIEMKAKKKISKETDEKMTSSSNTPPPNSSSTTRLITNKASLFITLRRKTTDLSLIASRLHTKFDDLQWVFTVSQVHTAMLCIKSINDIIARSTDQRRNNLRNLQAHQASSPTLAPSSGTQADSTTLLPSRGPEEDNFMKHVIYESSYHFDVDKINLVIADDGTLGDGLKSGKKGCSRVVTGGALLICLDDLSVDHYPRHKAGKNRRHFRNYGQILEARDKWADEIIMRFRQDFINLKKRVNQSTNNQHDHISASKLLESCSLIRLGEIQVEQVTSSNNQTSGGGGNLERNFLSTNRNELHLPDDLPFLSLQLTDYFYPDDRKYPSPHKNIFLRLTAPNLHINWDTVMWGHQLFLSTLVSVNDTMEYLGVATPQDDVITDEHVDVRIEALMPRILIPQPKKTDVIDDVMKNVETPDGVEIQMSEFAVTNCRCGKNSSIRYLQSILNLLQNSFIKNHPHSFPSCSAENQFEFLSKNFQQFTNGDHEKKLEKGKLEKHPTMNASSLKYKSVDDVWSIWIRQFWCDFIKFPPNDDDVSTTTTSAFIPSPKKKKKEFENWPFIDSIPLHIWISRDDKSASDDINILTYNDDVAPPTGMSSMDEHRPGTDVATDINDSVQQQQADDQQSNTDRPRRKNLMDYYRRTPDAPATTDEIEKTKEEKETKHEAKMNVLMQTEKTLSLKMKHFEFLFITEFVEDVQRMQSIMNKDHQILLRNSTLLSTESQSVALRFLCPSMNIYLILREELARSDIGTDEASSMRTSHNSSMTSLNSAITRMNFEGKSASMSADIIVDQMSDNVSIFGDDTSSVTSYAGWETPPPVRSLSFPNDTTGNPLDPRNSTLRKDSNELLRDSLKPMPMRKTAEVIALMEDTNSMTSTISDQSLDHDVTNRRNHDVIASLVALSSNSTNSDEKLEDDEEGNVVTKSPSAGIVRLDPSGPKFHTNEESLDPGRVSMERSEAADMLSILCVQVRYGGEICADSIASFSEDNSAIRVIFQQLFLDEIPLKIPKNQNIFASSALRRKMRQLTKEHQTKEMLKKDQPQVKMRSEVQTKLGKSQKILEMDMSQMEHELSSGTFSHLSKFMEDPRPAELFPIILHLGQIFLQINDDVKEDPLPPQKYQLHNADVTRTTDGTLHFTGLNSGGLRRENVATTSEMEKLRKELLELRKERDGLQEEVNKLKHR